VGVDDADGPVEVDGEAPGWDAVTLGVQPDRTSEVSAAVAAKPISAREERLRGKGDT
jgi:hypothetical protein